MSSAKAYQRVGPGKRGPIAVFDFETVGLGGEVNFATWKREGDTEAKQISGDSIEQEMFYIMCENNEYTWYAHNSQYDLRYLVEQLTEYMDRLHVYLRTDSDIFMVTLDLPEYGEKKQLVIKDSFALFPQSLEKFAASMCPDLPKLSFDWEAGDFDPSNSDHVAYALRDADSLLAALLKFNELVLDTFGVNCKATTASTAMAAWQHSLDKNERYFPGSQNNDDFIRSAYYGGLVFLTDTNLVPDAKTYDLNSSYPYQMMTHQFPVGNPGKTKRFESGKMGVYTVIVKTPDDLIVPILPMRDDKGITWPSGTFETTCTSVDLQFAIDHGYRLLAVVEGLVWDNSASPFKAFVEKCRSIRFAHKGTGLETVAKLMQNSLYGKFGTKKKRRKIYASLPEEEQAGCEAWGDFYIREEIDEEMLALPQWAAFVTAYARRHLLSHVYAVGPQNAIYGDTDSITVRGGNSLPTGDQYGDLKLEKEWHHFRARAPKVYAGIRKDTDKIAGAIKGVPRKKWASSGALNMVYNQSNGKIGYITLPSLMNVLKGDNGNAYEATRSISEISRSRSWVRNVDGTVRPKSYEEIAAQKSRKSNSSHSIDVGKLD